MSWVLWWNSVLWYSPQRMGDNAEGQTVARCRYKSRANSQMGTNREKMEHGPKYIRNKHNVSVHARATAGSYPSISTARAGFLRWITGWIGCRKVQKGAGSIGSDQTQSGVSRVCLVKMGSCRKDRTCVARTGTGMQGNDQD